MELGDIFGGIILLAVIALIGLFVFGMFATIVPAGNVGVVDVFGQVSDTELQPAWHWKLPWVGITSMTIKTQELKESQTVPSSEGLLVRLDTSLLYRIEAEKANEIYKTVGTQYIETIMQPQLRSVVREISARYEAKALYTSAREQITQDIFEKLAPVLAERGIILESVLLRDLGLPETVTKAIETKLQAEQESEQMSFVLLKEKQEAERKTIEAEGIKNAQEIIAKSLTPEYLHWYWIQQISNQPNVMYIATEAGLPLFRDVGGQQAE